MVFSSVLSAKLWLTPRPYLGNKSGGNQLVFLTLPLGILLMTHLDFGRFDTEEEAVAIANVADVGLAGRRPSSLGSCHNHFSSWRQGGLLNVTLGFERATSLEHVFHCFPRGGGGPVQVRVLLPRSRMQDGGSLVGAGYGRGRSSAVFQGESHTHPVTPMFPEAPCLEIPRGFPPILCGSWKSEQKR